MSYVRIQGVSKRFGDFAAVDDVSLSVRRGEIFCLLGGSCSSPNATFLSTVM